MVSIDAGTNIDCRSIDGAIDCYGRERDDNGQAIFREHRRQSGGNWLYLSLSAYTHNFKEDNGGDALAITELFQGYVPSELQSVGPLPDGRERPTYFIVTSPNMQWIPHIKYGSRHVAAQIDGRFYTEDFTLWPQWYFESTPHLPFIRTKPDSLESHTLAQIWWNMTEADFVPEEGSLFDGIGRLRSSIGAELKQLYNKLETKANKFATTVHNLVCMPMFIAMRSTKSAGVVLRTSPATFREVLFTVTAFQRSFLEALAHLDHIKKFVPRAADVATKHDVDDTIMGAITDKIQVADMFYNIGVPVWLMRPPSLVPRDINISSQVFTRSPRHLKSTLWPGMASYFEGLPSGGRNMACQALRPGGIHRWLTGPSSSTQSSMGAGPSSASAVEVHPCNSFVFIL